MKVYETVSSTVVTFDSEVDAESATQLQNVLSKIDSPINDRLIMDLEASSYLSADAVYVLLNNLRHSSYNLEFRNVSKDVGNLLDMVGLGNLIVYS
jgi:anti-anti-sigma factor